MGLIKGSKESGVGLPRRSITKKESGEYDGDISGIG
jgi:hypothetical protein